MSSPSTSSQWFWNRISSPILDSLSDEQRAAIEMALSQPKEQNGLPDSDIRLSFGWYYLVIRWGREKRSFKRLREERKKWQVLTLANMPVLLVFWMSILIAAYTFLALGMRGLVMLVS